MAKKPLVFETTPEGCFVCVSHKTNHDGYFRKRWGDVIEMFHRTVWKHHRGEIPEDMEVDHLCRNRACFNISHLRLLKVSDHKTHTNTHRYAARKQAAKELWKATGMTGTELAEEFGVTQSCACRWVREWRET